VILIDATYVNVGGGIALLRRLLGELRGRVDATVLRDVRVTDLDTTGFRVVDAPPSHWARRRFYRDHAAGFSRVLCFGNVPPLRRLSVPTATYFHNLLYCERFVGQCWRDAVLARLKMAYIRHHAANTDWFLVQSANMTVALRSELGAVRVAELPFFALPRELLRPDPSRRWDQFAYVAEAHPHKNHKALLQAWRLLLARGLRPGLHLTVTSAYPRVLAEIAALRQAGADVVNHGYADPAPIYARCGYQIYPSLVESFGLGLLEAADAGCAVLAADRPYVRAVIEPHLVFDPLSSEAIAAQVERCSGQPAPASIDKVADRLPELLAWLTDGAPLTEARS
jgi:glycosyltransferase involved in cell wall biosynthesis